MQAIAKSHHTPLSFFTHSTTFLVAFAYNVSFRHLQESHMEMQRAIREQSRRHRLELAHLNPRVGKLESGLDTTKTAFGDLTLDVELLSNMYRASLFELETNTKRMEALAAERDDVCQKLGGQVSKVVSLRRELERKDAIILQVMAARKRLKISRPEWSNNRCIQVAGRAHPDSPSICQLTRPNTAKQGRQTIKSREVYVSDIRRLREQLDFAKTEIAGERAKTSKLEFAVSAEKERVEDTRKKMVELEKLSKKLREDIRRKEAEKLAVESAGQEEKIKISEQEVASLRRDLEEARKAQGSLEHLLAKAEARNDALEAELAEG